MKRKKNLQSKLSELSVENLETLLANLQDMVTRIESGSAVPEELLEQDLLAHQTDVHQTDGQEK